MGTRNFILILPHCLLHPECDGGTKGFISIKRGVLCFKIKGCSKCIDEIFKVLGSTEKLPNRFRDFVKEIKPPKEP